MKQVLTVTGMTCGHCAHAVTEELSALPGVTSVEVDLVPEGSSTVTVEARSHLTRDQITEALTEAGDYSLA